MPRRKLLVMAEFTSISSLLSEKCEENTELQKYCQAIAIKYLDFAKEEFRALNAREENLRLKLDIGNLESIYRTVTENNEAQAELDSLLMEYYDEHLKFAFDIDEFELEKLASYDELKLELETRDSISMYQRLYERKLKMAKKMEDRNIVKKYRQTEQEYSKTKTERFHLEEKVNKLKAKSEEFKTRRLEESKLILQLVQGAADLKATFGDLNAHKSQSLFELPRSQRLSGITLPDLNTQRVGLSSRLLVNFKQFKIPSVPPLSRIRKINQRSGLNRLLQQSEVIRKSLETSPIVLSGEFATPTVPGILKIPNDYPKSVEGSQKTVSFDVDLHKNVTRSIETQEVTPNTLDPSCSETVDESEMEEGLIENESKKPNIEITEDVLIKSADKILKASGAQPRHNIKRKMDTEGSECDEQSPSKVKCSPSEASICIGSKSFMDMFLELSKDTPEETSPDFEPVKNLKQVVTPFSKNEKVKEKKLMENKNMEIIEKQETKASKKHFDGFEEFLLQFAGDTSDKEKDESIGDDTSFDFFAGNDDAEHNNDDDAGSNNLSFEF